MFILFHRVNVSQPIGKQERTWKVVIYAVLASGIEVDPGFGTSR
jgi:hypothetical protein